MGYSISEVRRGGLQVAEEEHMAGKSLLDNPETMAHDVGLRA